MALSTKDIDGLATALVQARRPGAERIAIPAVLPASLEEAYQVQDAVIKKSRGVAGWKVGAPSPTADPSCAPILAGSVMTASGAGIAVPAVMAVEVELAFKMAKAIPSSNTAPSREAVLAAIGSAHLAIELCATRFAGGEKSPPMALHADNINNFGLVLGPEIKAWRTINSETQLATVAVDGKPVVEMKGGYAAKDAIRVLVWQVQHIVTRRGGMPAGTVITTGSWTGIHWMAPPAKIAAAFPGFGAMEIALRAGG